MTITSIRVPDTISKLSDQDTYPVVQGEDVGGFVDLRNEVNSNTSKIETNITNINNLTPTGKTMVLKVVGDTPPDFTKEPHGNYFVTVRAMTKTLELTTPNPTGGPLDGSILTIFNEDPTNAIRVSPGKQGDQINNSLAYNVPSENFISFVYQLKDANWLRLEGGYIPAARINIANYVEQKLDADGKLHTEAELETSGFLKGMKVSSPGGTASTIAGTNWIHFSGATVTQGKPGQAVVTIAPTNGSVDPTKYILHFQTIAERDQWSSQQGSNYTRVVCVVDHDGDGFTSWYEWNGSAWEDHNAGGVILADSNGAIPKHIKTIVLGPGFAVQQAGDKENGALITYSGGGGGSVSLTLDDGTTNVAGIDTIDLKGAKITKLPTSPGGVAGTAEVTAGINIHMDKLAGGQGSATATEVVVQPPLNVNMTPGTTGGDSVTLEVKPDAYEPMHSPSFLAYLQEKVTVFGKLKPNGETDGHPKGAIWFEDVVVPEETYIVQDKINKAYGIQEADELDPNVTGGMNYLMAYRLAFKGRAPDEGFVRIYLMEKQVGTQGTPQYLMDIDGQPMMVERYYKHGEPLEHLEILGVVNAKGIKEFQCMVEDSFTTDSLYLENREDGPSGLMIQALKSNDQTGRALLQYMHDTADDIVFNAHYMGPNRMSIAYATQYAQPMTDVPASDAFYQSDGLMGYIIKPMKVGVVNGFLKFTDNASDSPDFHFGKVFSDDETRLLRGKEITVTAIIQNKQNDFNISLFKWSGTPGEATGALFKSRNSDGSVKPDTGWSLEDTMSISSEPDLEERTVTHKFTVPADANQYAIAIYPASVESTLDAGLKEFKVDVTKPFLGYTIHSEPVRGQKHFTYSEHHKTLVSDLQGYAKVRYTINKNDTDGVTLPVGWEKQGDAKISLDTTAPVANIPSSGVKGEGCIKFGRAGNARIVTSLRLWNEQDTDSVVHLWWAKVSADGQTVTKLPDSVFTATVKAGAQAAMYTYAYVHDFEENDRISLRASADKPDGAFVQAIGKNNVAVLNEIYFNELEPTSGDDPWGSLDMSQFEHIYTHELDGRILIKNASSATVNFEIEPHMYFDVKRAIKIENGVARPVRSLDYSYDYSTHELRISLGETVEEARVLVGVYV